jgi:hypothetical protein
MIRVRDMSEVSNETGRLTMELPVDDVSEVTQQGETGARATPAHPSPRFSPLSYRSYGSLIVLMEYGATARVKEEPLAGFWLVAIDELFMP